MFKTLLTSALVVFFFSGEKKEATVDIESSTVKWIGKKVTGQHNGTITLQGGKLEMDEGKLVGGLFTIDMASINCEDLSGGSKGKLENHLKSEDFFGVTKYPTATFVITKVVPQGPGKYKIVGDITIKDTTEEIQFPAMVEENDGKVIAKADIIIDRSKFNVRYGSGSFFDNLGDKTIYDDFELSIELITE
ncbi:MAG: YceI family protein [Bacteroidota bacterium]